MTAVPKTFEILLDGKEITDVIKRVRLTRGHASVEERLAWHEEQAVRLRKELGR